MGLDQKVGNRRSFDLPNHRLNKDAVLQILTDFMESVNNALVPVLGAGETAAVSSKRAFAGVVDVGWSTAVDTSTAGSPILSFPDVNYLVYGAEDPVTGLACTKTVKYAPGTEAQGTTSVILTALAGGGGYVPGYIWFRRSETDTSVDSEAHWTTLETFANTPRKKTEYVEFAVTGVAADAVINEDNGYFRFVYVSGWTGDIPTLQFIHFLDAHGMPTNEDPSANTVVNGGYGYLGGALTGGSHGLARVVKDLVNMMYMVYSSAWEITGGGVVTAAGDPGWFHHPDRGLKELHEDLETAETTLATHVTNMTKIEVGALPMVPIFAMTVSGPAGFSPTITMTTSLTASPVVNGSTSIYGSTGVHTITFDPASPISESTCHVAVSQSADVEIGVTTYYWSGPRVLTIKTYDIENDQYEDRPFSLVIYPNAAANITFSDIRAV